MRYRAKTVLTPRGKVTSYESCAAATLNGKAELAKTFDSYRTYQSWGKKLLIQIFVREEIS
jgi:hypothetical protein